MVPSIQKSRLANAQTQANHIHPSQISSNRKSGAERRQQGAMILVAPASRLRLALSYTSHAAGPSCVTTHSNDLISRVDQSCYDPVIVPFFLTLS